MITEADAKKSDDIAVAVQKLLSQPHIANTELLCKLPERHITACLRIVGLCKPRLSQLPSLNSARQNGGGEVEFRRSSSISKLRVTLDDNAPLPQNVGGLHCRSALFGKNNVFTTFKSRGICGGISTPVAVSCCHSVQSGGYSFRGDREDTDFVRRLTHDLELL